MLLIFSNIIAYYLLSYILYIQTRAVQTVQTGKLKSVSQVKNTSSNKMSTFRCFDLDSSQGKILEIFTDSHPILREMAAEISVNEIENPEFQQLIVDMIETMKAAPGIGLAAPQIGISKRLIVFYLPSQRDDIDGIGVPLTVLINPIVEIIDNNKNKDYEGCLSVPGMRGQVNRYQTIRYTGINHLGEPIDRIASGWHARLVQHEYDHLNGVVYTDLMDKEDQFITAEEYRALIKTIK